MTDHETSTSDAQVRAQIDLFVRAFRSKDVDAIMSVFAPDIVSFDLVPPLSCASHAAFRQHWERAFASYVGSIGYQVHDLTITVGDDIAFTGSGRVGDWRGDACAFRFQPPPFERIMLIST
jgi:ketosteroid isomerase-like protein